MRTPEGKAVGEHIGLSFYTIGQRKGVGIGGLKDSAGGPWYVCAKDMEKNELIVVQGQDHPLLLSQKLRAEDLVWVSGTAPQARSSYGAKTRYRQADASCRIDRVGNDELDVEFSAPQWAVTPGQSVVLYRDEACLAEA
jgi:tRNA-specific 2-thiouridylase